MKMKKLIAALLACVMLCAISVPALGEGCYLLLKGYLSDCDDDLCNLGAPEIMSGEPLDKTTFMVYWPDSEKLMLSGLNARGECEICTWRNVKMINGIAVFLAICNEWDFVLSTCDSGYTLVLDWVLSEDDSLFIDNAEDAAEFVETVMGALQ